MATTQTIQGGGQFPESTSVGAYPRSAWGPEGVIGAPAGSATDTKTVTNGLLAFTGLADNTDYVAYAQVSGQDRYRRFSTREGSFPSSGSSAAVSVALRGKPRRSRPVSKVLGYFGAAGHGWTLSSATDDATMPMLGTQSAKIAPTPSGTGYVQKALTAYSVVDKYVRVVFRRTGDMASLVVYLASDSTLANRVQRNIILSDTLFPKDQDIVVDIPASAFTVGAGTPDRANLAFCRVFATAGAGGGSAWIGGIYLTDAPVTALPNGAVVLSFDDSSSDDWSIARPKLAQYGYPATLFPTIGSIGQAGNFDLTQLAYMRDIHGFEVGAHAIDSAHHVDHVGQTEAYLRDHFEQIIAWQTANGFRSDSYAWPNTTCDALARRVSADYFTAARGGVSEIETHPPSDPANYRAFNAGSYTLAQLKGFVDIAKSGRAVAHFFFHALPVSKSGANDTARQDFYDLVDYIAGQGVPVYTQSQIIGLAL